MNVYRLCIAGLIVASMAISQSSADQVSEPLSDGASQTSTQKLISVFGICRDENQRPLAGVKVSLWKSPRARSGERIVEVSTDDKGHFRVNDFPAPPANGAPAQWRYVLLATAAGYQSQVRTLSFSKSSVEQVLNMPPAATLSGRVFAPNNKPVAGAVVWSGEADETMTLFGILSAKTDSEGWFSIADVRGAEGVPLHGSVVVLHPDYAQQRVRYPDDPGPLGVRLKEGTSVRGRVVDGATGAPIPNVVIAARYLSPSDRIVGLSSPDELKDIREVLSDERGEFRFTGLGGNVKYLVQAIPGDRVPLSNETILTTPGGTDTLPDLKLIHGGVIEGRVLTLKGEPLSRDAVSGGRLSVNISQNPTSPVDVDDEGRFRLRVIPGRHRLQIQNPPIWERTWRWAFFENGIDIGEGQTVSVTFRVGDSAPPKPRPQRVDGGKVPLPEPVAAERWAANEIRELGGWYQLDADKHVVEVNMVYCEHEGTRYDNGFVESDEALRAALGFPRLERLLLHKGQATDDAMAGIANLKELRMFFVWDCLKLTDAGVRHLAGLEKLENVHLGNGRLGDDSLEVLSGLPNLKAMTLQGNEFTDKGLAHLAQMEQLESLWVGLGKTNLTDAGLKHLSGLTGLRTLDLQRTGVTEGGIAELKRALPGLKNVFK